MATCPHCGARLEREDDRFCGMCGAAIPPPAAVPVSPQPATPQPMAAPPARPAARGGSKTLLIVLLAVGIPILIIIGIIACVALIGLISVALPGTGGGGSQIVLHNNSGQSVFYAYVSPCGDTNWGDDDLGSATVPNGGTFTFPVTPGCYDLKAEDSGHTVMDIEMGINVSGTYNWWVP